GGCCRPDVEVPHFCLWPSSSKSQWLLRLWSPPFSPLFSPLAHPAICSLLGWSLAGSVFETREAPRGSLPPPHLYLLWPAIWPMRKITNSAGFTGAMPISQTICPASTTSGGLVSASHLT